MPNRKLKLAPEESASAAPTRSAPPWKLLIVDDEPEVHTVTRLALSDFRYDGRPLQFISAYSGEQARDILSSDPEIAVMLLDVVMETDDAGLQVVQFTRRMLGNSYIRIILRTGHPGMAPERRIIKAFDINDYRAKTELTQDRMHALMYTSLRAYKRLSNMARSRRDNAQLIEEYRNTLQRIAQLIDQPAGRIHDLIGQADELDMSPCHEQLGAIHEELKRLSGKVERLSQLPHATEADQVFASAELVKRVFHELQAQADELQISLQCEEDLPELTGQADLFQELIHELVQNALQSGAADGSSIRINATARGKDWIISVCDQGLGIKPDQLDHIFKPLHGIDQSLGLARCNRIVALHGGRIWVEPQSQGGSCFQFSWPATSLIDE